MPDPERTLGGGRRGQDCDGETQVTACRPDPLVKPSLGLGLSWKGHFPHFTCERQGDRQGQGQGHKTATGPCVLFSRVQANGTLLTAFSVTGESVLIGPFCSHRFPESNSFGCEDSNHRRQNSGRKADRGPLDQAVRWASRGLGSRAGTLAGSSSVSHGAPLSTSAAFFSHCRLAASQPRAGQGCPRLLSLLSTQFR